MSQAPPDAKPRILASAVLQKLHDEAPADHFTLGWLTGRLHQQSFGLIMLVLSVVAAAPGISLVGGLLLLIVSFQMIAGSPAPVFPRWIAARPLPTRHLGAAVKRAIGVLKRIETAIHPRWPTPPEATKRVVGIAIAILSVRLEINPLPLSNIIPAFVMAWISLAYLEDDGLMLAIGLLAGFVVLAVDLGIVWELVRHKPA